MELKSIENWALSDSETSPFEGSMSKSKQKLKKCINQIGNLREKFGNPIGKQDQKLVAPKPIKARPMALNHHGNSKWLETSPIKNEIEAESKKVPNV